MDSEIALRGSIATAGDVVDALVLGARDANLPIPRASRAIVGRHAKTLLADGFRPDMVIAACWMALLRGHPEMTQRIAGDLALAETGMRMTRSEYEQKLSLFGARSKADPLAAHRAKLEARWAEINRLRGGDGNTTP